MPAPTARDLHNAYMGGTGTPVTITQQDFVDSYGDYGYFAAVNHFVNQILSLPQYGGSLGGMVANGITSGTFDVNVNHLITDIHSGDYLDRALGYGDQTFDVSYNIVAAGNGYEVSFDVLLRNEDYNFVGSGQSRATEFIRSATAFLLDPFGQGVTVPVHYTGAPVNYVVQDADLASHSVTYASLTADGRDIITNAFSSPAGLLNLAQHVFSNSPEFFYEFPEAGVTAAATAGAIVIGGRILLSRVDGVLTPLLISDDPLQIDSDGSVTTFNFDQNLSGLADITSVLDGTPLETFLPSAFWPSGGIEWDWSSVSFDDVDFAVPFATPGNSYTPLPGIVVSGNGGQFIGSFAQTNDGRPAISVTDTITGTTQTYMETASGVAGVVIDNGSYTGTFTVAPGSDGGSLGAFLDPSAGIGQFDGFVITDNDTGDVVGEGLIVGSDGINELGGGEGRDTIVGRTRDRTTGEWQTTVTSTTPLERFNHDTLVGGQVGTIFGSALSQAIPTDNVFEQVAANDDEPWADVRWAA